LKVLLDSNVLVWMFLERTKLTRRAIEIPEDDKNEFFVSRTSFWELSATVAAGRLKMPGDSIQYLMDQVAKAPIIVLELEDRYILRTQTLSYHHSDPFDRILVAQALEHDLTIMTADKTIPLYQAPVIWR
jgi:PIN domain nuclease of toxin-antitoxin system